MNRTHVCSFLIGLSAGSVISLLFAPQAGARTRSQIGEAASEGADYLKQGAAQVEQFVAEGKRQAARQKEAVVEGIRQGTEAYQQTVRSAEPGV